MNITISSSIFAAAALFRGIDDIRYYLNGLYLETGANGARLVGCDGHQLAVARLEGWYPESSIILPASLVAAVKSKAKGPQHVVLEFKEGGQQFEDQENSKGVFVPRDITLTVGEISTTAKELDGKSPDYRRVVPSEVDGATAQFDPSLINCIDKACSILGYKSFVGIVVTSDHHIIEVSEKIIYITHDNQEHLFRTGIKFLKFSIESEQAYLQSRIVQH